MKLPASFEKSTDESDHNFDMSYYPINILNDPITRQYVAGTGWHGYGGSASAIDAVQALHPDKNVYFTEQSGGGWNTDTRMGNMFWYMKEFLMASVNRGSKSFLMWNLALNEKNGPTTTSAGCQNCRGVITIKNDGTYTRNEEYYLLGHFSKFVRLGAVRIKNTSTNWPGGLTTSTFMNTDGSKVVIVLNQSGSIDIDKKSKTNSVLFRTNLELPNEAYKLNVTKKLIIIEASSSNGFFNAVQTLRQLLPPQINSGVFIQNVKWSVPCVKIIDSPRFRYRGFMLDVSRYFMPKKDVLRLIDFLAYHKINYFHWHLTDDNGWRIEIKKYPRLTDIGAWRVDRSQNFPMRRNAEFGEAATQGGFYTQDDIREVVKYAQERFVEIIPEIEMPAHTNSSLAAYPHLACPVLDKYIGVLPGIGGKNANIIYCAGND